MKKNNIQKALDIFVNQAMEQVNRDIKSSINFANKELYKEAVNMFNSYIEDFYSYETSSYIRNYEFIPGTKKGSYLYNGKNGAIVKWGSWESPKLTIDPKAFGQELDERQREYQYNSSYEVMQHVVTGIRFVGGGVRMRWNPAPYNGKYFKFSGSSINDAFYMFNEKFDEIAAEIVNKQMRKKGYR